MTGKSAWGIVEVKGLAGAAAAAEAMKRERSLSGLCAKSLGSRMAILVQGSPDDVSDAVGAGAAAAQKLGVLVSSAVMEDLDPGIAKLLFGSH